MAAYVNWTGDEELYKRSYTYRLRELWSDQHRFNTMFPWIANDISFPLVPVLMLLIGGMFGASWRDAVFGRNDCAVVVFAIFLIMMGYLPANSQITLAPDHLFALLAWIFSGAARAGAPPRRRRQRSLPAPPPDPAFIGMSRARETARRSPLLSPRCVRRCDAAKRTSALLPVARDATLPAWMRAVRLGRGRDMDFLKNIEWPMWFGYAAVASSVLTCAMKTMIPLRVVSMVCNSFFIVYGLFGAVYPTLLLNLILLPLNSLRLLQMQRLIRDVEAAASYGETSIDWLRPFMARRSFRKGDIVFSKGEVADAMYYSVSGRYRLREMGLDIPNGQVFGELGLISPSNLRTQTVECTEDGEVLTATYLQVRELYFQNPQFGFYFLRLTSERLFQNIDRLEQELTRKNEEIAALTPKPA